jgi:hypothetical protein
MTMSDCDYRGYRIVTERTEEWRAEIYAPGTYGLVGTVKSPREDERSVIILAQTRIDQDCPRHC